MTFEDKLKSFFVFDIAPEVISSAMVILIMMILAIIIGIQAKLQDPLKKPKGLLLVAEMGVKFFDGLVAQLMGERFKNFGGFIMAIAVYLFISFIFGLTGLPSPVSYLAVPLSLALITFVLIHATSIKYTKMSYFKRYVDPFPVFLPINLISMWAPLLSLTLRLFGNAIAGWTLMTIVYWALENLSSLIFSFIPGEGSGLFIAPLITPVLHAYFDLFSGFIQTTVFIFLSMIFISVEAPEEVEYEVNLSKKGGK